MLSLLRRKLAIYCTEPATEWLPVLDESVRKSFPGAWAYFRDESEVRDALSELYTVEGRELGFLDDQELYCALVAIYLMHPSMMGFQNEFAHRLNTGPGNPVQTQML